MVFKKGHSLGNRFKKGHTPWHKGKNVQLNTGRTHFKKEHVPWNKKEKIEKICLFCKETFYVQPSRKETRQCCSLKCAHQFKKNIIPWNKNKHPEYVQNENHWAWKGDKVGYFALHMWIKRNFGKPFFCFNCYSWNEKKYHWANISGKYTRELSDYVSLCASCHKNFDGFFCGEDNPFSKLSEKDIHKIRENYHNKEYSQRELSRIFKVSQTNIFDIIHKKIWKHI